MTGADYDRTVVVRTFFVWQHPRRHGLACQPNQENGGAGRKSRCFFVILQKQETGISKRAALFLKVKRGIGRNKMLFLDMAYE